MPAIDVVFRSACLVSLLVHAVAFGSVWGTIGHRPRIVVESVSQDIWVGTTVNVVEEQTGHTVPSSPMGEISQVKQSPDGNSRQVPRQRDAPPSNTHKSRPSDGDGSHKTGVWTVPALAPSGASSDLKQAMLDASNQKANGSGTFGAVGVDLRERRLPAAFTRALPVAIGAEPGWWRHHAGTLGGVRFEVALDDSGKITATTIEDEATHALIAGIVRRVVRLLAVGRYALPELTLPNARQRFELRLDLEQGTPSSNESAEPGDAVDMGWEAPTTTSPGKAHIQETLGRTMRATLKLLPARERAGEPIQ
jgi:hypothetical protein